MLRWLTQLLASSSRSASVATSNMDPSDGVPIVKLIVGLGNPGHEYEKTRHNAGFLVLDALAAKHASGGIVKSKFHGAVLDAMIGGEKCLLLKPLTYMNRSGQSVAEAARFYKLDPAKDVLVVVDDLALPSGKIRLRASGGSGGHNGLSDIDRVLGTQNYPRLRVGIDAKPDFMDQAAYVTGRFTDEQWALLQDSIESSIKAIQCFVSQGITMAMNKFNAPALEPRPSQKKSQVSEDQTSDTANT